MGAIIYPSSEKNEQNPQFRNTISVIVKKPNPRRQDQEDKESAANFTKTYNQPVSDGTGQREYKISNHTVSDQPAVRVINRTLPGDGTETYYSLSTLFRYGIYDYSISFGSDEKFIKKNAGIYDQIVESFKLIGPAPTVKPIALKSYRNEKHGYSFQYPSNWLVNGDIMGGQIIVVDENDREMFTLTIEPRYGASCPPDSYYGPDYHTPEADIQFGSQKVHLKQDCNGPWVNAASGQEFRLDGAFYTKQPDQRLLNLLKSIQGLKVVP